MSDQPVRVLFVCTGNICRSPAAEIIARHLSSSVLDASGEPLSSSVTFASAGTASWHAGQDMDPRARSALVGSGFEPPLHRAQVVTDTLLGSSDLVVALDRKHKEILKGRMGARGSDIVLLRPFDPQAGGAVDIADPYYGDHDDFVACIATITAAVSGLTKHLNRQRGAVPESS